MKIALVHPVEVGRAHVNPPLGLCYLAASLRQDPDCQVQIIDANLEDLSVSSTVQRILDGRCDMVGLSFMTPQADFAYELSAAIKMSHRRFQGAPRHGRV